MTDGLPITAYRTNYDKALSFPLISLSELVKRLTAFRSVSFLPPGNIIVAVNCSSLVFRGAAAAAAVVVVRSSSVLTVFRRRRRATPTA